MPFLEDPTWPAGLLTIFKRASTKQALFEDRYYGPYDKLLNYCFGESFTFYVAPQTPPRDDGRDAADFIISIVVFDAKGRPVLLVEIKDDYWVGNPATRNCAEKQMQGRYDMMLANSSIPSLWGLSLLGTKMRVYRCDKVSCEIYPEPKPRPEPLARVLPPDFLEGEWNTDILSQEGFEKMKNVVHDIVAHTPNDG